MIQWILMSNDWHTSVLGDVCQEDDGGWYFYPRHGDWVLVPYGPTFDGSMKARAYAESREGWI